MERRRTEIEHVDMGNAIPRVFHIIYLSANGSQPPPAIQANMEAIKRKNPGWELRVHTDDTAISYIAEHYGEDVCAIFRRIEPRYAAARSDLLRYLVIYNEGGCYLDCKSFTERPLDEVLRPDDKFILSNKGQNGPGQRFEGYGTRGFEQGLPPARFPRGSFEQWFIISVKGHPFLRAVIERVLRNVEKYSPERMGRDQEGFRGVGRWGVVYTTGPVPYTLAIEPIREMYPHRRLQGEEEIGLTYSIFMDGDGLQGWDTHMGILGTHYSKLTIPVVDLSRWGKVRWSLYQELIRARVHLALGTRLSAFLAMLLG